MSGRVGSVRGGVRPGAGVPLGRLKRRPEFLAVAGTRRRWVAPGLILQVRRRGENAPPTVVADAVRVGFTASRKVGNAVARNRAKRRLRAAAGAVLPLHGAPGQDFVLIARATTAERPFAELTTDIERGLCKLKVWQDGAPSTDVRS